MNISDPTKTLLDHAAVSAGWVNVCFPPLDCMAPPNISSNLYGILPLTIFPPLLSSPLSFSPIISPLLPRLASLHPTNREGGLIQRPLD